MTGRGSKGVSNAVKKYVRKVASKTKPEMKSFQTALKEDVSLNTVSAAASFLWNEPMATSLGIGAGKDQRVGQEIYLQGHHSKVVYTNNTSSPILVRRLIVGYGSGTLANSVSAELFDASTGVGTTITTVGTGTGLITTSINKAQFKVYFDKTIKLAPNTSTDGNQTRLANYFTKFGGKKIRFEGTSTGFSSQDWRFGEIYLIADAGNDLTTGGIELSYNQMTYFTDP
jgi:hypothetical protein